MATHYTNVGKAYTAGALSGDVSVGASFWVGWGTGSGVAVTGTTLATAAAEARSETTKSRQTTTVSNDTFRNVGTITCAGAGKTITEAGLFTALTGGTMLVYGDFTGVALGVGDSIQFTVNLVYS